MPAPVAPDRLFMDSPGLSVERAHAAANYAVHLARTDCPKLSGQGAKNIFPMYGVGHFGLHFLDYIWIQNTGARPFVMRSLAGKTIPMWIDDPTGTERRKYPHAETREKQPGRIQVLIFRRAARFGQRKLVARKVGGITVDKSVPMSYPGAPGRITLREAKAPYTTPGRLGGRVARGNVGIRWYFPGLQPRGFLNHAVETAALYFGIMGSIRTGYNWIRPENEEIEELSRQYLAEEAGDV
jgi:hypothetical protein